MITIKEKDPSSSMTLEYILSILRRFFEENGSKFGIHYAILFGSLARGESDPLSDVDIAVKLHLSDRNLIRLAYELEGVLDRNFDLVDVQDLDLIMLFEVYTQGVLIYCRDIAEYYDDYVLAISKYLDFAFILKGYEEELFGGISRTD